MWISTIYCEEVGHPEPLLAPMPNMRSDSSCQAFLFRTQKLWTVDLDLLSSIPTAIPTCPLNGALSRELVD
jgi:hypothetical protein